MIESQRVQIRAQRHGMVKMAGELKAALSERDAALEKLHASRKEAEARREEDMCTIASLRAWAELVVGGGGSWGDAGGAWVPSGAHVNDILSSPQLAVQTALAAGATQAAATQDVGGGESEQIKSLRRQLRFHENEDTPPRSRSLRNRTRAKYKAVVALAHGGGGDAGGGGGEALVVEEAEGALAVSVKVRGGQIGHKGASNSQKAEARFAVYLQECPECHGNDLEKRRPGTKRVWDVVGEWVLHLSAKDGRAEEMADLARRLAVDGAHGPCVCVSVMFERKYCRLCGKVVKASVTFLIEGTAIGEICQSEALLFAERVPDTFVAMWLGDLHGFPLKYDAVRTGRLARRRPLTLTYERIEDHIAAAPWHIKDESPGKGCFDDGGGEGAPSALPAPAPASALPAPGCGEGASAVRAAASIEEAAASAVRAAGASSNRQFYYLVATVPDAVLVRTSPSRSGRAIRGRLSKLGGKPYVSDEFVVYTQDGPSIRQTDHPHLLRKTGYSAAEALRLLYAEGKISYAAVVLHRRAASE